MDKPMNEREDCITMITDSGESVDFYVLEETRIHGKDYLLVTDAPGDEDGECYILKDVSGEIDSEALFFILRVSFVTYKYKQSPPVKHGERPV